jgi:hypothetical protein
MQFGAANRFMLMYDRGFIYRRNRGVNQFLALDAAFEESFHYDIWQAKYDRTLSANALLQLTFGRGSPPFHLGYHRTSDPNKTSAFDEITRVRFDAANQDFYQKGDILVLGANLTYFNDRLLGAAHDLKFGMEHRRGRLLQRYLRKGDLERRYQAGVPYRVMVFNTPVEQIARNFSFAGYVQDSVRAGKHLTLNLGLRTEWWRGDVPEQGNQPGTFGAIFGPASGFAEQLGVMEWRTVSPRLGLVYDIQGDSKTVLKATYGRYFFQIRSSDLNSFANKNGLATAVYDWTDLNGNNYPDFPAEFGVRRSLDLPGRRSIVPGLDSPYSDEFTASVERALSPSISVTARYNYRTNEKQLAQTDLALPDEAFSIPSTAVDPLTGRILDYWSLGPEFASVTNQVVLSQFDSNRTRYHGLDLVFNRRFDGKWLLMGSLTIQDNFGRFGGYMDRNDRQVFPDGAVGLDAPYVGKLVGTYILPGKVSVSAFFRHVSGMNANNSATPEMARVVQVRDVTNRSLYRLRVEENGALRQDSTDIVDLRFSKSFEFAGRRLEAMVDAFNLTNANNILATGVITGSDLGVPLRIVSPRVIRLGVRFEF